MNTDNHSPKLDLSDFIAEVRASVDNTRAASNSVPCGPVDRLGLPPSALKPTADRMKDEIWHEAKEKTY